MKKICRKGCGHLVGGGGDAHGTCPPPKRAGESARARKRRLRKKKEKQGSLLPQRGIAVAGIHKVSASSDRSRAPKKKVVVPSAKK